MEQDAVLSGDLRNFGKRLNSSNLIIGVHDRDKDRIGINAAAYIVRVDLTEAVYRKICDLCTQPLKELAWFQYRRMLDPCRNDMGFVPALGEENSFQGVIV